MTDKCPKCGCTNLYYMGFAAICPSEDCDWIGLTSSVATEDIVATLVDNGMSSLGDKAACFRDAPDEMKQLIVKAANFSHVAGAALSRRQVSEEEQKAFFAAKMYVLQMVSECIDAFDGRRNDSESRFHLFTRSKKDGVSKYSVCQFGFPPLAVTIHGSPRDGITDVRYCFDVECDTSIWHPIDWSCSGIRFGTQVRYLGVIQHAGKNITYFANEDMETSRWTAGISERTFLDIKSEPRIVMSKATDIEDAVGRLSSHFDKTVKDLQDSGEYMELKWSSTFGYEHSTWQVAQQVFTSWLFENDMANQACLDSGKTPVDMATKIKNRLDEMGVSIDDYEGYDDDEDEDDEED